MSWFRSCKTTLTQRLPFHSPTPPQLPRSSRGRLGLAAVVFVAFACTAPVLAPTNHGTQKLYGLLQPLSLSVEKIKKFSSLEKVRTGSSGISSVASLAHTNIITTVFWVGEGASGENAYISNSPSTWDDQWQQHYGGIDDPTARNGFMPTGFTPKENPFYVALPYNDLASSGGRKPSAQLCLPTALQNDNHYSWCKNTWVMVRHNGKVAYAQWEDAGPMGEDDIDYIFGLQQPKNTLGERAGLDVSPAVRDFLQLQDVDRADWALVAPSNVPNGPWRQIVTTSLGWRVE